MKDQLKKLVVAGKIKSHDVEPLLRLLECGYGYHKTWGAARIKQFDTLFGRLIVDFVDRQNHQIDIRLAARIFDPLPPDHILVKKLERLQEIKRIAKEDPKEILRIALKSYPAGLTLHQLKNLLTPDIIEPQEWEKWWTNLKNDVKKDPHFIIPKKPNEPLKYLDKPLTLTERYLNAFKEASGLRKKLQVIQEALQTMDEIPNLQTWAAETISLLNEEIKKYANHEPSLALTAIFLREEIRKKISGLESDPDEPSVTTILQSVEEPVQLLQGLPASRYVDAVKTILAVKGPAGKDILFAALERGDVRLCGECIEALEQMELGEEVKKWIHERIKSRNISADVLAYVIEKRSKWLDEISGETLFMAILNALETYNETNKKMSLLGKNVLNNPRLLIDLLEELEPELVMDLTRSLLYSSAFDPLDRRALVAQIAKEYPYVDELLMATATITSPRSKLLVTPESFEAKQRQLNEIVSKLLPETSKLIEEARAHGDLRENAEYKAAREKYFFYLKRRAELEQELASAEIIRLTDISTDAVGLGTKVTLRDMETDLQQEVTILGAWDASEDGSIISYLSPLGQALLGRRVGDVIELEGNLELEKQRYRIEKIEVYKPKEI